MAQTRPSQSPFSTPATTLTASVDDLLATVQARSDDGLGRRPGLWEIPQATAQPSPFSRSQVGPDFAPALRPPHVRVGSGLASYEVISIAVQVITMIGKREWVVTASAERPLEAVAADLASAGFEVQHVVTEMGVIAGSASEAVIAAVRMVPGVVDISPGGVLEVGPPDADIS